MFVCNINDCSKHHGGRQSLLTDSGDIPINIEEERLPYTYIREPTTEEIQTLPIVWVVPFQLNTLEQGVTWIKSAWNTKIHVDEDEDGDFNLQPDIPKCTRQNPILDSGLKAPLSERLANFPTYNANQTLIVTTQLRDGNIDMDQQEISRINHKKRGVPLVQRRLEGRTDSDTFFSSVKSIRGYRCVELFFYLLTLFLWIENLQREK